MGRRERERKPRSRVVFIRWILLFDRYVRGSSWLWYEGDGCMHSCGGIGRQRQFMREVVEQNRASRTELLHEKVQALEDDISQRESFLF
ncbi:hypothetical protein KP509_25G064200 [Ceratopteris richardii]|uniref:Uncharacterized protein n=1 Tax=Ceratopteris richardii TaxID=49495 RepID=A0A8T2RTM4_CERRI|nr:hypothetical protein KP509_25G064200 [Ceratopteris richardii]